MQPPHFARIAQGHDMPSDHTRAAILNSAERLYADRGFADVTLRDIVAAADVNLAAVNYHFGSKDELIAELFVSRSLATNRERLNELKAAEAAGGGRAGIDAILRAVLRAGSYELEHRKDVPGRVVVSEYVDVAHAFVEKDETGMVNAVLDQIARQFRADEFARG